VNPLQVSHRSLYGQRYTLTGHLYISLNKSLHVPSQGPHGQGYSVTRATGLFIHSFMYVCWGPQKAALLHMGGKHKVTAHRAHADGRPHTMGCGLVPSRTCSVSHIPFPLTIVAQTLPYNREQKCDCVYLGFLPLMAGL